MQSACQISAYIHYARTTAEGVTGSHLCWADRHCWNSQRKVNVRLYKKNRSQPVPLFSIQAASSFKNPNERTPSQDPKKGASLGFGFDNGIKINEADVTKGPA